MSNSKYRVTNISAVVMNHTILVMTDVRNNSFSVKFFEHCFPQTPKSMLWVPSSALVGFLLFDHLSASSIKLNFVLDVKCLLDMPLIEAVE